MSRASAFGSVPSYEANTHPWTNTPPNATAKPAEQAQQLDSPGGDQAGEPTRAALHGGADRSRSGTGLAQRPRVGGRLEAQPGHVLVQQDAEAAAGPPQDQFRAVQQTGVEGGAGPLEREMKAAQLRLRFRNCA